MQSLVACLPPRSALSDHKRRRGGRIRRWRRMIRRRFIDKIEIKDEEEEEPSLGHEKLSHLARRPS